MVYRRFLAILADGLRMPSETPQPASEAVTETEPFVLFAGHQCFRIRALSLGGLVQGCCTIWTTNKTCVRGPAQSSMLLLLPSEKDTTTSTTDRLSLEPSNCSKFSISFPFPIGRIGTGWAHEPPSKFFITATVVLITPFNLYQKIIKF